MKMHSLLEIFSRGSADVWGKMEGNLVTGHQAAFKSKARFEGALQCNRIFIEDGALF